MPDEKEYMTNKNETHCSEGDIPCTVKTKGHGVCKEKELYLNATDHQGGNGNVELLAKQKDIVSVVGDVQDSALENATNDSKKTAEGIVEKLREPVKYYNEDAKNRPINITIGELMNELGTVNR